MDFMFSVPSPAARTCLRKIIPMASATTAMAPTTTTRVTLLLDRSTALSTLLTAARVSPDIGPPPVGRRGPLNIDQTSAALRADGQAGCAPPSTNVPGVYLRGNVEVRGGSGVRHISSYAGATIRRSATTSTPSS